MTTHEKLVALVCASTELDGYVADLTYQGVITEEEAKGFDRIIEKIDKVAEAIRHEAQSTNYAYVVHEDWHGIIGYHKTFEGAKKHLMEDSGYEELVKVYPTPDYDDEICWGWDVLYIEKIELGE